MIGFRKKYNSIISLFLLIILIYFDCILGATSLYAQSAQFIQGNNSFTKEKKESVFIPGDAIEISVFPDTTSFLNNVYPIDGAGYVFLPKIGKTKITDKSQEEFTNFLKEVYRKDLRFPYIKVRPLIRISVLGGVQKPGLYFIDPDYSLWNVIQLVGGTLNEDGLKKMKWERDKKVVKDNLIPFLQSGVSLGEIGLKSGDQIWVPSPNRPNIFTKINTFLPYITFGLSMYTFYLYIQSGRIRRARF